MLKLSADQQAAIDAVLQFLVDPKEHEMAISGPAGTGKTVLTRYILRAAREKTGLLKFLTDNYNDLNVLLTSTTNKAAKVLFDATGEPTRTIHSVLGLKVFNDFTNGRQVLKKTPASDVIQKSLIIVDEASMCDSNLFKLIQEMTFKCKVIYIGDAYQLAPVFETESPVFKKVKNQVKLTTIQRQVAGSPIIQFASKFRHALDTGNFPVIGSQGPEVQHLKGPDFKIEVDRAFNQVQGHNYARIVAWTNKRVHAYNDYIRKGRASSAAPVDGEYLVTNKPIVIRGSTIHSTDTVFQVTDVENDVMHDVPGWNVQLNHTTWVFQPQDINQVEMLMKKYAKEKNWKKYFFVKENFADLRPIFSNTVNKAQGSTYENVFIDVQNIGGNKKDTEIARLMYTAITRASSRVFMTGDLPSRLYV